MVNKPKIENILRQVNDDLLKLDKYRDYERYRFISEYEISSGAKYHLLTAIEGCLRLGNHIISDKMFAKAETYADVFRVLGENQLIDEALSSRLIEMARFRNRIVHLYWEIDDSAVFDILANSLDDIREFISIVAAYCLKG
jgi:uncharacterized protein YutE (UPF0331/DUF86 family)